ncbi:MAG: stage II sporulation protein P [Angelakisella sp.]
MKLTNWLQGSTARMPDKKTLARGLAAVAGAAAFLVLQPLLWPLLQGVVGQAALFSTAISLPEGAMKSLRERFAGELLAPPRDTAPPEAPSTSPQAPSAVSEIPPEQPPESASVAPPSSALPPSSSSLPAVPIPSFALPPDQIPKAYRAPLIAGPMLGEANNPAFLQHNNVWLRNYTKLSLDAIQTVLETDCALQVEDNGKPQVLLYHTHTTESYEWFDSSFYDVRNSWRDTDNTNNMAAVGAVLAAELEQRGITVLHDDTQHDQPAYNGAYERSRKTVSDYLKRYPSIAVTIDLHRDGIVRGDNSVLKPVVEVKGKKAAQLMMIAPCDNGSVGVPHWKENLRFAVELQSSIESSVPNLCRPIFFCYRNYNLGLTRASLLFELGTNGNTLEEALYTAQLLADPIAAVVRGHMTQ